MFLLPIKLDRVSFETKGRQNLQKTADFLIESIVFCPLVPPSWISLVDPTSAMYTSAIYVSYIYGLGPKSRAAPQVDQVLPATYHEVIKSHSMRELDVKHYNAFVIYLRNSPVQTIIMGLCSFCRTIRMRTSINPNNSNTHTHLD